jgi:hypothetical protein
MAEVLEVHTKALGLGDENARGENAVYLKLAEQHGELAAQLRAVAEDMSGYRDLPMGRHDHSVMSSPQALEAFAAFLTAEQQLLALLQERLEQDREMLSQMRTAGGGS